MSRVYDSEAGQSSSGSSSSVPPTPTPSASVGRKRRAAALALRAKPVPSLSKDFSSSSSPPRSTSEPDLLCSEEGSLPATQSSSSLSLLSSQLQRSAASLPSSDLHQTYTSSPAQAVPSSSSSISSSSRGRKRKTVAESPDHSRTLSARQTSEQPMSSSSSSSGIKRTSRGSHVHVSLSPPLKFGRLADLGMRQQKQLDYEPPRDALLLDIEQSHLDHSMQDSAESEVDSVAPEDDAAAAVHPSPKRARHGKAANTTSNSIFGIAEDDSVERQNDGDDDAFMSDGAFVSESDDDEQSDAEDDYFPDEVLEELESEQLPSSVRLPTIQDSPRRRKSKSAKSTAKSKTTKGPGGRPPLVTDEQKIQEWTTDPITKRRLSNQEMMYTRYHSSEELNFLKKHGHVTFAQGSFTRAEEATIIRTIVAFGRQQGKPVGDVPPGMSEWSPQLLHLLRDLLTAPRMHKVHIINITKALRNRPIQSVFHHLKHVDNRQQSRCAHPWTPEEDKVLRIMSQRYKDHRDRWQDIVETRGALEGRSAQSLKDRWRDLILPEERNQDFVKKNGKWTKEEEERLQSAVEAAPEDIHWAKVEGLVGTRTARQCRKKWRNKSKDDKSTSTAAPEVVDQGAAIDIEEIRRQHGIRR